MAMSPYRVKARGWGCSTFSSASILDSVTNLRLGGTDAKRNILNAKMRVLCGLGQHVALVVVYCRPAARVPLTTCASISPRCAPPRALFTLATLLPRPHTPDFSTILNAGFRCLSTL
jgi:hypothetical protein